MCSFRSCQTRFEFLSQFRKVRNAFECFVTQVQTRLPKSKCVWPMKINVICTVATPPRREVNGHGASELLGHVCLQGGYEYLPRFLRKLGIGMLVWTVGRVPWSPENILIDTVARLQRDLAEIRAESRQLRTLGVQPVVPTPRQAAFMTTKVPRFAGTTSWEQYRQVFDAIVLSNGWNDATAALQLLSHLEGGGGL